MCKFLAWLGLVSVFQIFLNFETVAGPVQSPNTPLNTAVKASTLDHLLALSPELQAGQMMMVGISGTSLNPSYQKFLAALAPGAVILFQRNVGENAETSSLTESLQKLSTTATNTTMLIATDQEGGRVARVKMSPKIPSPMALGQTSDPQLVENISFQIGNELNRVGINMNLAPVVDVLRDADHPAFVGDRSFGWQPEMVRDLGFAFARGQLASGVIPTAKHFPGSGTATGDPHAHAVQDLTDAKAFAAHSYLPYQALRPLPTSAVMLSHFSYPNLDASGLPATLSNTIATQILRTNLGYEGLVLTDDLTMGALKQYGSLGDLAVKSIKAGASIVMVSWGPHDQIAVRKRLAEAIRSGELNTDIVRDRLSRIAQAKDFLAHPENPLRRPATAATETWDSLELRVLQDNLRRQFPLSWVKSANHFGLLATHPAWNTNFKSIFKEPVAELTTSALFSDVNQLRKKMSAADAWIAVVDSGRIAQDLRGLPADLRKKILVMNEIGPGWLRTGAGFAGVQNLYHHHDKMVVELAKLIQEERQGHASNTAPSETSLNSCVPSYEKRAEDQPGTSAIVKINQLITPRFLSENFGNEKNPRGRGENQVERDFLSAKFCSQKDQDSDNLFLR